MATRVSYTDTTTDIPAVSDAIYNIDFNEAGLLQLLGFSSKNLSKFAVKAGWPSTTLTWLEDINVPKSTTLNDGAFDSSQTDLAVAANTGQYFRKGDILGIYANAAGTGAIAEKFLVTAQASDTLTIVRGYGDTTGAAHDTGSFIRLLTRANEENSLYTTEHITTPTSVSNQTQILDAAVEMSETEVLMSRYGITDHMDMQVGKLFDNNGSEGRLAQLLHETFYYGEKVARAAPPVYGSMGGFNTFVTTSTASSSHVVDLGGAAFQRDDIFGIMRAIRNSGSGARVTHLVMNSWALEKISLWEENKVRITAKEQRVVNQPEVQEIITPHGSVRLVYDWMCPQDEMYFINADKCGWVPYREFKRKTIYGGNQNNPYDGHIEQVIGEYTFGLTNPKSFGRLHDFSITA
jgi:hypothetical protein